MTGTFRPGVEHQVPGSNAATAKCRPDAQKYEDNTTDDIHCRPTGHSATVEVNQSCRNGDGHFPVLYVGLAHKPERYFGTPFEVSF
jgi:hypothetical protein